MKLTNESNSTSLPSANDAPSRRARRFSKTFARRSEDSGNSATNTEVTEVFSMQISEVAILVAGSRVAAGNAIKEVTEKPS